VVYDIAVALRKLEKKGSSVKVRETAAGALWIIEDRVKQIKVTPPAKPGLYYVPFRNITLLCNVM